MIATMTCDKCGTEIEYEKANAGQAAKCSVCGELLRLPSSGKAIPQGSNAPSPLGLAAIGCGGLVACFAIFCGFGFYFLGNATDSPSLQTAESATLDAIIAHDGNRVSGGRSQIIAATEERDPTKLRQLAESLRIEHGMDNVLVSFYASPKAIDKWDGSGLIHDDQSYVGRVSITPSSGRVTFTPSPF